MRRYRFLPLMMMLATATPSVAAEYIIMKVNQQDVSSAEVVRTWESLFPQGQAKPFDTLTPDVRERVLRAVMAEKIIYDEAIKQGADKAPGVVRELEEIRRKLIITSFLKSRTADSITEADLKREYDSLAASSKNEKEVRARHVLLASETEAKEAKKKIDAGTSFETVAREISKDPGSAKQGGDLGYFTRDKMVKEFADAAFSMKKGEVSGPVKSQFGYHIIKVEDQRSVTPPSFVEAKEPLRAALQEKKLNGYVAGLVGAAQVKLFDAKGKEIPFEKNLPEATKAQTPPVSTASKPAAKPLAKPVTEAPKPKPASEVKPEPSTATKPAVTESKPATIEAPVTAAPPTSEKAN